MDQKIELSNIAHLGLKIILISLGLSLIFFIPFLPLGIILSKGLVLSLGAATGLLLYFIDCISVGRLVLPRGAVWKVFLGLVISAILTSFFVPNPIRSFVGSGFDLTTVSTLIISFIYFFLINTWGQGINLSKNIFKTVFLAGFIVVGFSLIQFFFDVVDKAPKMFIGLFRSNLVGSYYDLALFVGLFVILLTISIEANFWKGPMKIISTIGIVASLGVLFLINYSLLWYVVGISGLVILIVGLIPNNKKSIEGLDNTIAVNSLINKKRSFSVIAFLLVFCAFIGIVGSKNIAQFFAAPPINFSVSEPRPSIKSSLRIIQNTYYYNPIAGAGLNRYNQAWEMGKHKILGGQFIASPFWSASFNNASSVFLSFITTLGVVSGIFFVWFMFLVLKNLWRLFSKDNLNKSRPRDLLIYGFTGAYGFLFLLLDNPNTALFVVILSVFAMIVVRNQTLSEIKNKEIWFLDDTRRSFFGILILLIGSILTIFAMFVFLKIFYSGYLSNRAAMQPLNSQGVSKSKIYMERAFKLHPLDNYARGLVDLHIVSISQIVRDSSQSEESLRSNLTNEISLAANATKSAIAIDPNNYQNHVSLLKLQETIFQLGDKSTYTDVQNNINKILSLTPENIGIMFRHAKIAALVQNYSDAYGLIDQIVEINPFYVDAYILRSQISMLENNPEQALSTLSLANNTNPSSAALIYQRGLIYLSQERYSDAVVEFEKALRIAPRSLDVYSSLVLTYEKLGQKDSVLRVLNNARQYVEDKTQIDSLIERVNNGLSVSNNTNSLTDQSSSTDTETNTNELRDDRE